jgi:hypothetical protein
VYQLDWKRVGEGPWSSTPPTPATSFTLEGLTPGTKYVARARGGVSPHQEDDPGTATRWGPFSVESQYATAGGVG